MKTKAHELLTAIKNIKGAQFASLTYKTVEKRNAKNEIVSGGEISRYTVILGFNYNTLVEKSVTELEVIIGGFDERTPEIEREAAAEVMASLQKTLEAHERGEQNEDYTKKGQYIPMGNGISLNTSDNTIQLFGLIHSKVVLKEGVRKEVKSKPLTIAKNKIRKQLSVSKFREFALDLENIGSVRLNGETIELIPSFEILKEVEGDLTETQMPAVVNV